MSDSSNSLDLHSRSIAVTLAGLPVGLCSGFGSDGHGLHPGRVFFDRTLGWWVKRPAVIRSPEAAARGSCRLGSFAGDLRQSLGAKLLARCQITQELVEFGHAGKRFGSALIGVRSDLLRASASGEIPRRRNASDGDRGESTLGGDLRLIRHLATSPSMVH